MDDALKVKFQILTLSPQDKTDRSLKLSMNAALIQIYQALSYRSRKLYPII